MRTRSLFSLFGIALCVGTTLVACSGDDDDAAPAVKPSGKGQSCARTADCASKLVCVDQVCQESGSSSGGSGGDGTGGTGTGGSSTGGTGTGGSSKGGTGGTGTGGTGPAPVLGGEGESCTRAADCETGLGCYNQRCAPDGSMMGSGGEAGSGGTVTPPPGPPLGQYGETCVLPSDCAAGLTCVPGGIDAGNLGVCSITDTGVTATGKSCSAECQDAEDCCELPLEIQAALTIRSCADLADVLAGVDCSDPGSFAAQCFAQSTYCDCNNATWTCNAGACTYRANCSADGLTTDGCATFSRSGRPLPSTCVDDECGTVAGEPLCNDDADCDTLTVTDDLTDTCSPGECTCYQDIGCYRKCADDLDCAVGFVCDAATEVCVAAPECVTQLDCQRSKNDVDWVCRDNGTCVERCNNDLDCNAGDIHAGGLLQVCENNECMPLGCADNDDCTALPVRMFCVEPTAPGATVAMPNSAITTGQE
jgi:hypothetical protein